MTRHIFGRFGMVPAHDTRILLEPAQESRRHRLDVEASQCHPQHHGHDDTAGA